MLPKAKKSFGQNWLRDPSVVKKIVAAAEIKPGERVLEIGPGTGVLTEGLLAAGAKVTAIEADPELIRPLQEKFLDRIELIAGDALDFAGWAGEWKLVANIPYNITSAVLQKFLSMKNGPELMVLMMQKEVAQRITAKPPQMSLLSVVCQLYAAVRIAAKVPAGAFQPRPKVDSAVVVLVRREGADPEAVIKLAKAGFAARRKQLHGNLAAAGVAKSESIKAALRAMGLNEKVRAENLTAAQWPELFSLLK